ncbi:MAG: hypothetical protein A2033_07075 [Bacteroidetes bacterium GWA2_31_9]|nr:MAG: hypothetical protein A2033_07075 [Bacteroidetes bacterium GWA2_31_9]
MENFTIYNPVKLVFGKNVIDSLPNAIKEFGDNVLIMSGKNSIMENGIYEKVTDLLKKSNISYSLYSGIKSNPVVDDVVKAIAQAKFENSKVIMAIGGGSVIDSAKVVSICINENLNPWDVMTGKVKPSSSVPLISVLTLSATGSEMNQYAVLQNDETKQKIGYGSPLMFPKYSFLDPQFTFSVSREYTAFGITDIIAHALEAFFAKGDSVLSDNFIASIIKETMANAQKVLLEPHNYEYRANIMLASTCALNGITAYGKASSGDWGVHDIGHTLSVMYDIPHGASLSIAYPAWLKLMADRIPERISTLGKLIFDTSDINSTIEQFEMFFKSIISPVRLSHLGITNREAIIKLMEKNKVCGFNLKLTSDDYVGLVDLMM